MQDEARPGMAIFFPTQAAAQAAANNANPVAQVGAKAPSEVATYTWHDNYGTS